MSPPRIIDAGPALNFFSINKERLLISVLGKISAPEIVEQEIFRKARTDPRFESAERVWTRAKKNYIEILPDDTTDELSAVVQRLTQIPLEERRRSPKDLGETMVVAHAVVAAETGVNVVVVIDEGNGVRQATLEARRLDRLRAQGSPFGTVSIVDTVAILRRAATGTYLRDKAAMRDTYAKLKECDDGLMPIERTDLLSNQIWQTA